MTETIRAFVALEIPGSVRDELAAQRDGIEKDFPAARWTRPPGWHLTLKFLGETDRAVLDQLVDELGPRLRGLGAVQVRLHGGGFFPSPKRPRVAWIGGTVDGAAPVVDAVEEAAARARFEREKRPWALHLTMARIKKLWSSAQAERYLAWAHSLRLPAFTCREAVLFSSRLEPGGAVYTALERISLE